MKIVVIGGTGMIGSKTVAILRQGGHEVVAGSPQSGINTITGEGLNEAMVDTQVVIDGRQAPKRSKRTSASAVVGKGEASTRSGPGATQGDRSNCSRSLSLIDDNGMSAERLRARTVV
jgi:hypothetical protein